MKSAIFALLLSATLTAQDSPEARAILRMVSEASQTVRSYRAEYHLSTEIKNPAAGTGMKMESRLTVAFAPPNKLRMEMNSGMPVLMIGDGKAAWMYMPTLNKYSKFPTSAVLRSVSQGFGFLPAFSKLQAARILKEEPVVVNGAPVDCFVIAAEYETTDSAPSAQATQTLIETTLWVDKSRYTILRNRTRSSVQSAQLSGTMETTTEIQTASMKTDISIPEEEFVFTPPQDATEMPPSGMPDLAALPGVTAPVAGKEPLPPGVFRVGGGVSAPALLSKVEPKYSAEARKAGLEGTVALSLVVDENGLATEIRVLRPLGYGLDEMAVEAVQQWRFKPGMKENKPVRVVATIEVSFRLLKKPATAATP